MFTKILLGSDGSDCALKAANVAGSIAQKYDAEIIIVTVYVMPHDYLGYGLAAGCDSDPSFIGTLQQEVLSRTEHVIEPYTNRVRSRAEIGYPAEVIVRIATDEHASIIILGSRGHGPLRSMLLGTVTDRVAHHAHCPVLIVR